MVGVKQPPVAGGGCNVNMAKSQTFVCVIKLAQQMCCIAAAAYGQRTIVVTSPPKEVKWIFFGIADYPKGIHYGNVSPPTCRSAVPYVDRAH
ncbi:hypothetical protein D3C75_1082090 [compost metagenome]